MTWAVGQLAQLVEQTIENRFVPSSILGLPTLEIGEQTWELVNFMKRLFSKVTFRSRFGFAPPAVLAAKKAES